MIIAVDGPSGAGKSSVSREVAARLGWSLLDTGAIYRCVALVALEHNVDNDPEACAEIARKLDIRFVADKAGQKVFIGDRDVTKAIRTFETTQCVNHVAPMSQVRAELLNIQRRLGHATDSIVEGRDIGSVVFPDAGMPIRTIFTISSSKFFSISAITASSIVFPVKRSLAYFACATSI